MQEMLADESSEKHNNYNTNSARKMVVDPLGRINFFESGLILHHLDTLWSSCTMTVDYREIYEHESHARLGCLIITCT